ncbi:hypothetical protein AYO20_08881 [Fonsecaea nubica]|uniref:Uncharacterized protein n=1 Tax=Fonsecaea nubica TaxID=856822 RepID=A0A178CMF1_9EURO|nr:hypothetical protein AYO20_08881 [Fonsecaea nubica]OAL30165.1 hypothetical protein AYO20_08881 [Fonsecaea nubica]
MAHTPTRTSSPVANIPTRASTQGGDVERASSVEVKLEMGLDDQDTVDWRRLPPHSADDVDVKEEEEAEDPASPSCPQPMPPWQPIPSPYADNNDETVDPADPSSTRAAVRLMRRLASPYADGDPGPSSRQDTHGQERLPSQDADRAGDEPQTPVPQAMARDLLFNKVKEMRRPTPTPWSNADDGQGETRDTPLSWNDFPPSFNVPDERDVLTPTLYGVDPNGPHMEVPTEVPVDFDNEAREEVGDAPLGPGPTIEQVRWIKMVTRLIRFQSSVTKAAANRAWQDALRANELAQQSIQRNDEATVRMNAAIHRLDAATERIDGATRDKDRATESMYAAIDRLDNESREKNATTGRMDAAIERLDKESETPRGWIRATEHKDAALKVAITMEKVVHDLRLGQQHVDLSLEDRANEVVEELQRVIGARIQNGMGPVLRKLILQNQKQVGSARAAEVIVLDE